MAEHNGDDISSINQENEEEKDEYEEEEKKEEDKKKGNANDDNDNEKELQVGSMLQRQSSQQSQQHSHYHSHLHDDNGDEKASNRDYYNREEHNNDKDQANPESMKMFEVVELYSKAGLDLLLQWTFCCFLWLTSLFCVVAYFAWQSMPRDNTFLSNVGKFHIWFIVVEKGLAIILSMHNIFIYSNDVGLLAQMSSHFLSTTYLQYSPCTLLLFLLLLFLLFLLFLL
ncbi:hypothetical protein RFI_22426 [Reticulomyxa filosa]|uniref:Uncharacterized protein n=1 Tax=Reticulomyxa filosa TaxID=46433 RepID=X6MNF4_RETFI|nr:hypothetical protein RFI_22426 [Reticulomyxa filosa]|eukprot:ETO14942.1 hypothetical protein RFI_22426 [Reticulomyxa filosa]